MRDKALRKTNSGIAGYSPHTMKDHVRASVIMPDYSPVSQVVQVLKARFPELKGEYFISVFGYRAFHLTLPVGNGVKQRNTAPYPEVLGNQKNNRSYTNANCLLCPSMAYGTLPPQSPLPTARTSCRYRPGTGTRTLPQLCAFARTRLNPQTGRSQKMGRPDIRNLKIAHEWHNSAE